MKIQSKNKAARVSTIHVRFFKNTQGQLTLQSVVGSGQNLNSWLQDVVVILITAKNEDPIKNESARLNIYNNINFSNTQGQLTPKSEVGPGRILNSCKV